MPTLYQADDENEQRGAHFTSRREAIRFAMEQASAGCDSDVSRLTIPPPTVALVAAAANGIGWVSDSRPVGRARAVRTSRPFDYPATYKAVWEAVDAS